MEANTPRGWLPEFAGDAKIPLPLVVVLVVTTGVAADPGGEPAATASGIPASLSIAVGVVELVTVEVVLPLTNRDSKLAPTATFASPEIDQRSSSRKSPPAPNCGPMKLLCVPMTSLVPVMVLVEFVKLGFPGSPRAFANVVTSVWSWVDAVLRERLSLRFTYLKPAETSTFTPRSLNRGVARR